MKKTGKEPAWLPQAKMLSSTRFISMEIKSLLWRAFLTWTLLRLLEVDKRYRKIKSEICALKWWQEKYHNLNKKLLTATNTLEDSAWEISLSKN